MPALLSGQIYVAECINTGGSCRGHVDSCFASCYVHVMLLLDSEGVSLCECARACVYVHKMWTFSRYENVILVWSMSISLHQLGVEMWKEPVLE